MKKHKPTSFTTSLRNPSRIFDFLRIIKEFEGQILTNDLTVLIESELIREGIYKPMKRSMVIKNKAKANISLSDDEVKDIIKDNPQHHKEAEFDEGWPSRFQTHYMILREFGLINYAIGSPIEISPIANQVLDDEGIDVTYALSEIIKKYWSNNLYRLGVMNNIQPLKSVLLALKEFERLNTDQIFAVLCMPDMDVSLYKDIIRNPAKTSIESMWINKFNENAFDRRRESVDDFIRKITLTGWILYKPGKEKYIEIDQGKIEEINEYINKEIKKPVNKKEYFEYLGAAVIPPVYVEGDNSTLSAFEYWDKKLSLQEVVEMLHDIERKKPTKHEELKYVERFILLELGVGLFLSKTQPNSEVFINLNFNSDFIPTSAAPGGRSDIYVISENGKRINVEVTFLNGTAQHKMESFSTVRHAHEEEADSLLFISPNISPDLVANYQFESDKTKEALKFSPVSLKYFIDNFESDMQNELDKVDNMISDRTTYNPESIIEFLSERQ